MRWWPARFLVSGNRAFRYVDQFKGFIVRGAALIEANDATNSELKDALRRSESLVYASKELSQEAKADELARARAADHENPSAVIPKGKMKGYLHLHKQKTLGEAWPRV